MDTNNNTSIIQVFVTEDSLSHLAVEYACRLASYTQQHIQLLYVLGPTKFQHWLSVGKIMHQEGREQAEQLLLKHAVSVQEKTSQMPIIEIREGEFEEEILQTFEKNKDITHFIIADDSDKSGKSDLLTKIMSLTPKIPAILSIVPKDLSPNDF